MSIEVHHGGVLKKVGNQNKYIGGTVSRWDNIDEDTMSWFELRSMLLQVNIVSQYMVFQRQTQYDILIDSDVKVMNMLKNLQVDKKITLYIVHLDHKTADEDFLPDYCLPDNVNAPEIEITSNHEITPHALVAPNSEVVAQNSEVALYASNPNNYEVQLAESEDDFEVAKDVSGLEADDEVNDSGKSRGKKEVYGGTECDPQIEVEMEYEKSDSLHTPSNSDFEEDDVTSKGKVGSKDVTSGPTFNEERDLANPMLEVGMEFTCPADFRLLLRHYACVHGYDLKWSKNEGRRITVECKGETCKFRAFGSWNKDKTIFVLKSLRPDHNCSRVLLNKQMSSKWLAKKYLEHFRVDRSMKFDVFRGVVLRDFGVGVSKQKFYRAKSIAFDEIDGKILDQFKRLRDYAFVLLETNPGSHVVLKTKVLEEYNNAIGFEAIFISFAPMIRGLLE